MSSTANPDSELLVSGLPGAGIVLRGLNELKSRDLGECGLLVLVASIRLTDLGLNVPVRDDIPKPVTHELYNLLERTMGADAYSHYNALMRTLASFIHALELRVHPTPTYG